MADRTPEQRFRSYPREAIRATFRYDARGKVTLANVAREEMIAPPQVGEPPRAGTHSGTWIELADDKGDVLSHVVLHDPFKLTVEHHSPEGVIERFERPLRAGEFDVLLPAMPRATNVAVFSSPLTGRSKTELATEIARFNLDERSDNPTESAS